MIDLRLLRENPGRFKDGARKKGVRVDIDRILDLDKRRREALAEQESLRAEQNRLAKEAGPKIGQLMGESKKADEARKAEIEREVATLRERPAALKTKIQDLDLIIQAVAPELERLLLEVPQPPDADVPEGKGAEDNVQIRTWNPPAKDGLPAFDATESFESQRGFRPRNHMELMAMHRMVDFERGVKIAGSRSYLLTGWGARLHFSVLRYAMDFMAMNHGFTPVSVPVLAREEALIGTGFFPAGREQVYRLDEQERGGQELFLTGTGEVSLMAIHQDEILDEASLPLKYTTVSTCFRREAGAAGRDTAGLYRVHQFDKCEQVVICRPDEAESRAWHRRMIEFVEQILQSLHLPYRLLQCCTGDLGVKNADMIDIESWMPARVESGGDERNPGAYAETHSASRLYDYQCRRLNLRVRGADGKPVVAHSLNNTVLASPRILIPLVENHQQEDGSIVIPPPLRPYLGGAERITR
ncbi:MAG: serine--tRNA ligase [Phycisphaerales bacterium]